MYKLNYFNFKSFKNELLITNDLGEFLFITNKDLDMLLNYKLITNTVLYNSLLEKGFIYENKDCFISNKSSKLRENKSYLFEGTQLHIFVLTNKCNLSCIYCQAKSSSSKCDMMNENDAFKFVDIALQSTSNKLAFEFQGGEPTLNFDIIKKIFYYTESKKGHKKITYNLVTNLFDFKDEHIKFLLENNINFCTSIDGDSEVHNYNRISSERNSYEKLQANIKKVKEYYLDKGKTFQLQAIQTTTRKTLENPKKLLETFLELEMNGIFLRPLTPLGNSIHNWKKIGYTPEEFLLFYKEILNLIIELNKNGIKFIENNAILFLKRIFKSYEINYMELRSPCGAGIGQIAYNYDGNIYTCDEGRMLKEEQDSTFLLGGTNDRLQNIITNDINKSVLLASCLEILPGCSSCVYQQYCGVCPVYNYKEQKNIFSNPNINYKCKINKGILDIIFNILSEESEAKEILLSWIF